MTLEARLTALAQAIGADVKTLLAQDGNLTTLTTDVKTSIVAAINELQSEINAIGAGGAAINDAAGDGVTTQTWSANKIYDELVALKAAILGSAGAAYDTLQEIQTELEGDDTAIAGLLTAVGLRVSVEVQAFSAAQKTQARANIGALSTTEIGDPDHNFVTDYNTAKA